MIRLLARTLVCAFLAAGGAQMAAAQQTEQRTYLINGLASAVPFIGYGFANLKDKIPGAKLYSYISPIEGQAVIRPRIMSEIREAHRRNPNVEINLIGISYGANLITRMGADLEREGIQVSYMGLLDGLPLARVTANVRRVDNFICNLPGCLRDKVRFSRGNKMTIHHHFAYNTTHIALGNNSAIHQRILHQITTTPLDVTGPSYIAYTQPLE